MLLRITWIKIINHFDDAFDARFITEMPSFLCCSLMRYVMLDSQNFKLIKMCFIVSRQTNYLAIYQINGASREHKIIGVNIRFERD